MLIRAMPAHSKRDNQLEFPTRRISNDRRTNSCCFQPGVNEPNEAAMTGARNWSLYNGKTDENIKQNEMADGNSMDFYAIDLPIGQPVLVAHRGRQMSGNVVHSTKYSSFVDIRSYDHPETVVTASKRDIKLLGNANLQQNPHEPLSIVETEERTEACKKVPLVIDIPNDNKTNQDHENTEESMAAAVLTSLSLSPVLPATFELSNGDFDVFEDRVINTEETTTLRESEERQEGNRRTKTRRRKNSFKTLFQCTWPRCGKVFTNSSGIIRHVRLSHLGPKNDDGFSDGEEEFYFNEIELNADQNTPQSPKTSISPPLPRGNPRRGRSMSDPSRPTQPLVSSMSTHGHVDDNFTWPLRVAAASRTKTKRTLHQTMHTNMRRGRGDGRKCRKVYGMENKQLWCTQCRWKKACIKFID